MEQISWQEIKEKLQKISFDRFDIIVAIGRGGIIPAALLQQKLNIPMEIIWLNLRDEKNQIINKEPVLYGNTLVIKNKKIILVDDVSRTGSTLKKAKELLKGNQIKTFLINGKADYSLYDQEECLLMPWKI